MSAIMARQEGDTYSYENIVTPNKHAVRSNVVVGVGERVKIFPESVPTENFNVIGISLDTYNQNNDASENYNVNLLQGLTNSILDKNFSSPFLSYQNFYRNYPVANNFMNVELHNPAENDADLHANVVVTLSKYTQFNPPTQIGDNVNFKSMANLAREGNLYLDDVSRGLYDYAKLVNIQGMTRQESANTHVVCPIEFPIPTSNTYTEVYAVSDSPSDTMEIFVRGDTDIGPDGRASNGLELQGTTPSAISLNRFKSIDTVDFFGSVNTGNISIYTNGTNIGMNYIPAGWANTAAAVYYISKRSVGVLKYVEVNGYSEFHVSRIRAVIQDENTGQKTVWESRISDGNISRLWTPDLYIDSNHTLYVELEGTSPVGTDQEVNVNCKIIEYYLNPGRGNL